MSYPENNQLLNYIQSYPDLLSCYQNTQELLSLVATTKFSNPDLSNLYQQISAQIDMLKWQLENDTQDEERITIVFELVQLSENAIEYCDQAYQAYYQEKKLRRERRKKRREQEQFKFDFEIRQDDFTFELEESFDQESPQKEQQDSTDLLGKTIPQQAQLKEQMQQPVQISKFEQDMLAPSQDIDEPEPKCLPLDDLINTSIDQSDSEIIPPPDYRQNVLPDACNSVEDQEVSSIEDFMTQLRRIKQERDSLKIASKESLDQYSSVVEKLKQKKRFYKEQADQYKLDNMHLQAISVERLQRITTLSDKVNQMNEYIESLNGASKKQMDKLRRKYNRKVRHYEELKIKYKEQHQQLKRFEDLEEQFLTMRRSSNSLEKVDDLQEQNHSILPITSRHQPDYFKDTKGQNFLQVCECMRTLQGLLYESQSLQVQIQNIQSQGFQHCLLNIINKEKEAIKCVCLTMGYDSANFYCSLSIQEIEVIDPEQEIPISLEFDLINYFYEFPVLIIEYQSKIKQKVAMYLPLNLCLQMVIKEYTMEQFDQNWEQLQQHESLEDFQGFRSHISSMTDLARSINFKERIKFLGQYKSRFNLAAVSFIENEEILILITINPNAQGGQLCIRNKNSSFREEFVKLVLKIISLKLD